MFSLSLNRHGNTWFGPSLLYLKSIIASAYTDRKLPKKDPLLLSCFNMHITWFYKYPVMDLIAIFGEGLWSFLKHTWHIIHCAECRFFQLHTLKSFLHRLPNRTGLANQRQIHFTTGGLQPINFVLATSPFRHTTRIFIYQLNTYEYSPYVTFSLTRAWVCRLHLLLVFASAVILR
jgi:hypothetical protein